VKGPSRGKSGIGVLHVRRRCAVRAAPRRRVVRHLGHEVVPREGHVEIESGFAVVQSPCRAAIRRPRPSRAYTEGLTDGSSRRKAPADDPSTLRGQGRRERVLRRAVDRRVSKLQPSHVVRCSTVRPVAVGRKQSVRDRRLLDGPGERRPMHGVPQTERREDLAPGAARASASGALRRRGARRRARCRA
jgi:hypothetical protein